MLTSGSLGPKLGFYVGGKFALKLLGPQGVCFETVFMRHLGYVWEREVWLKKCSSLLCFGVFLVGRGEECIGAKSQLEVASLWKFLCWGVCDPSSGDCEDLVRKFVWKHFVNYKWNYTCKILPLRLYQGKSLLYLVARKGVFRTLLQMKNSWELLNLVFSDSEPLSQTTPSMSQSSNI